MRLDLARDYWTNARNRELTWAGCKLKPRAPMQEVRQRQLRFLRAVPTAALTGLTRAEHRSTPMDTLGTNNAHHGDAPHCGQTTMPRRSTTTTAPDSAALMPALTTALTAA